MKYFEDINLFDEESFKLKIGNEEHEMFSKLSMDKSLIHIDDNFAKSKGFKERIGYAFFLTSLLSRFYGELLPGGSSICLKQEAEFIKPFYRGETITLKGRVTSKSNSTKIIEIKTEMSNEKDELIFRGKGLVKIIVEKENSLLFIGDKNNEISSSDLSRIIKSSRIKNGDSIFIHSDLKSIGRLPLSVNRDKFLDLFINALKNIVGESGNILMPSFTYSYCKKEIYDPKKTPSTIGVLTEHFRKMPDVKRSQDAIFSIVASGPKADYFTTTGLDCFGENSIFEKLYYENVKLVFIGETFDMTFIHYIEQKIGSPYRFIKEFTGQTKTNEGVKNFTFKYNVRDLEVDSSYDFEKISNFLKEQGVLKEVPFGNSRIRSVGAKDTFDLLSSKMVKDPYFLLKNSSQK